MNDSADTFWSRMLDSFVPLEAWIYSLFPSNWVSFQAQYVLWRTRHRDRRVLRVSVIEIRQYLSQPENWLLSIGSILLFLFLTQGPILFSLWHLPGETLVHASANSHLVDIITTAWQVLASIVGLTFVIVVFLLEFANARAFESRSIPLFIRETSIIPIVMFEMVTLLSLGVNVLLLENKLILQEGLASLTEYNLLLFAISLLLTIHLYITTLRFINPGFFRHIFLQYNREQVVNSVEDELKRRITVNLIKQHCDKYGIEFSIWSPTRELSQVEVNLPSLTRDVFAISDVNLQMLKVAAERAAVLSGANTKSIIFWGYHRTRVSAERPEIAYVPKTADQRRITELLRCSVRLTPIGALVRPPGDDALQLNRDLLSDAIRSARAQVVEELLDQYEETLHAFLAALEEHGLRYSAATARHEDGYFQDWEVITKIQKHYIHLVEQALRSTDREIVFHFVGFPFGVMSLAQHYQDQLVFRRFAILFEHIYRTAKRVVTDRQIGDYVNDRCWRLLVEFYDINIQYRLQENEVTESDAQLLGDYGEFLIMVFNRLLKSALDFRDIDEFRQFAEACGRLSAWIGRSPIEHLDDLQAQLSAVRNESMRLQIDAEINQIQVVAKPLRRVQDARQISFMGLGGWLVHLLESKQITSSEFQGYSKVLAGEFGDARKFYALYSRIMSDHDIGDSFGWDSWELEERPESPGEFSFSAIKNSEWIGRYYVYRAVEMAPLDIGGIPELAPTSSSKAIRDAVNKNIDEMTKSDVWSVILVEPNRDDFQKRVASLREMLEQSAKRQEVLEEDQLIRQPLDADLIKEFGQRVQERWVENATLRNLFKYYRRYEDRPSAAIPEGLLAYGFKKLEPKGVFVNQSLVGYVDWGENFGRGLARGENTLLSANFSKFPVREALVDDFDAVTIGCLQELRSHNLNPVILLGGTDIHLTLFRSKNYKPRWNPGTSVPDIIGVEGLFDGALVARLQGVLDDVIVVDLANFAVLVQYAPDASGQFPLSISIGEITRQVAEDLLKRQPDLVRNSYGKTLTRDAALRYLQQRVLVDIWERSRFEDINSSAGYRIHFAKVPHDSKVQRLSHHPRKRVHRRTRK